MPLKRIQRPDGSPWWVRQAYDPRDYAVPAVELEQLRSACRTGGGALDELALHDGAFASYQFVRQLQRDGKTFVLLVHPCEWAIEVELIRSPDAAIGPVPPADAWRLARARDLQDPQRPIDFEGAPPAA